MVITRRNIILIWCSCLSCSSSCFCSNFRVQLFGLVLIVPLLTIALLIIAFKTMLRLPQYCKSTLIEDTVLQNTSQHPSKHKDDYTPYIIKFDSGKTPITFKLARNFGFCAGVKNALSLAYAAIEHNCGKRIFLLSEIIHNQIVNRDLTERGVRFIMDAKGNFLYPLQDISPQDIVIVPAFGITLELQKQLSDLGIEITKYDTTCPFVQKVWHCAEKLGNKGYTIIIHGDPHHEETKSTFSRCAKVAPTIVLANKEAALELAAHITQETSTLETDCSSSLPYSLQKFASANFDSKHHLNKIGLVNQTTMLANTTEEISEILKEAMLKRYCSNNSKKLSKHFADTRHTLCYATYTNQNSTLALCRDGNCDIALIVGGYNSSNTRHLVEIAQKYIITFFIKDSEEILSANTIRHFDLTTKTVRETTNWLPKTGSPTIAISAGASCPDKVIEDVMTRCATV